MTDFGFQMRDGGYHRLHQMRNVGHVIVAVMALAIAGCSGAVAVDPAMVASQSGPHGGQALALPSEKGFVEVVVESAHGSSRTARQVVLVAYFLGPDAKSPLTPPPTTVSAWILTPASPSEQVVTLGLEEGARFSSLPGDFEYDELRGELTIVLGGETIKRAFTR